MLEFFQTLGGYLVTTFVLTSMLNVGLTQKPSKIISHLRNWHFLVAMVIINLVVVPALMVFALQLFPVAPYYETGLLVFSLSAGAPFLIKLTQVSEHDISLGATVMMILMVATVIVMPLLLPALIEGASVNALAIVKSLLMQMMLPMVVGMLISEFLESLDAAIQPWIARISNIALYGLIVAILIGYSPNLLDLELWKAMAVGAVTLTLAFFTAT